MYRSMIAIKTSAFRNDGNEDQNFDMGLFYCFIFACIKIGIIIIKVFERDKERVCQNINEGILNNTRDIEIVMC